MNGPKNAAEFVPHIWESRGPHFGGVAELADALDSKSSVLWTWRFESSRRY